MVSLIVMIFIFHVRSALRILIEIPVSILIAFILMRQFGITSNIMSLGGIAIAIGVLVDSSIVLVENAYRNIAHAQEAGGPIDYTEISIRSAQQVGRAIFFSLAIIVVSFLPVFMLQGQEGKLFHPLAWTKTFALAASAIISITLVPMLMTMMMRGKFRPEARNPVSRFFHRLYEPVLRAALRYRKTTLAVNIAENAAIERKVPAAIFSMEMSAEALTLRMISSLGRVSQSHLRTGRRAAALARGEGVGARHHHADGGGEAAVGEHGVAEAGAARHPEEALAELLRVQARGGPGEDRRERDGGDHQLEAREEDAGPEDREEHEPLTPSHPVSVRVDTIRTHP